MGRAMAGAAISGIERKASTDRAGFDMNLRLSAPGYAKMQGRLMMFTPVVLPIAACPTCLPRNAPTPS